MWGLGCLIWEVFNGTLPRTSSLKALGKVNETCTQFIISPQTVVLLSNVKILSLGGFILLSCLVYFKFHQCSKRNY